jgi:hypothetical protein
MTLLEQTMILVERDRGDRPRTARETGLKLPWLQALADGKIADPGVKKIEQLNIYLREKYPRELA